MHFGHGHGGHGHGHWGHRHFGSSFYAGGSCYKTIFTVYGPRTVNVCDRIY
jgi:hypothetical protein